MLPLFIRTPFADVVPNYPVACGAGNKREAIGWFLNKQSFSYKEIIAKILNAMAGQQQWR
tara:strand:- start:1179 stop:1358 length:180 start_codon:yes stop_codon:yes gene_type:complete